MRRSLALLASLVALVCAARAPAATTTTQLTPPQRAVGLTAFAGHVVFSVELDGRWTLHDWHDGRDTRLPVPSRAVPFDADTGPDATGRPVVVYSRCAIDPSDPASIEGSPDWGATRGCHVHELALRAGGREHPVRALFAPGLSDTTPTIWRDRIAFARRAFHGVQARPPLLFLAEPGRPLRRLHGGTGSRRIDAPQSPWYAVSMDLGPTRLAFEWNGSGTDSELRVDRLARPVGHELALRTTYHDTCSYTSGGWPHMVGARAVYVRVDSSCTVSGEAHLVAVEPGGRQLEAPLPAPPRGLALYGETAYWLRADGALMRTTGLRLTPVRGARR